MAHPETSAAPGTDLPHAPHPAFRRTTVMLRTALLLLCCCWLAADDASKAGYEVIDWSKSPKGDPGETTGDLKHPVKGGEVMRYHLFAPATLPVKPVLGLILCFHGTNGDENGMSGHAHEALVETAAAAGYVVAGGKSLGNAWGTGDEANVLQFVDWLMTVYPIDRRRLFTWGHSNGGWMSSYFASHHADRFAGLVRWAGYGADQPSKPGQSLEYYLVHGDMDASVKVDQSRALRDLLRRPGHYVYRELKGADHGSLLGFKAVRDDAARWIDALRHPDIPLAPDELKLLRQFATAKGDEALAQDATWAELVRIGGQPAWSVAAKAAKSKTPSVRAALCQACARCRFADEETVAVLGRLAEDEDATVAAAAIAALGVHANWRCAAAQATLARLALGRKSSVDARSGATSMLASALTLPLLGNTADDTMLFDAATALMDAEPAALRTTIFAPLQLAVSNGMGYDPQGDAKARRPGIIAWRTWFDEHGGATAKH
jgi:dienelactone hydrolase